MYILPETIEIDDKEYEIIERGDYRSILTVIDALNDITLAEDGIIGNERVLCACMIFYPDWDLIPNQQLAAEKMCAFIDLGQDNKAKHSAQKTYDWRQDEHMISAAISRVLGQPVRAMPYLHWWDFISAFYEIGEGQFSFVVGIRDKLNRGTKLEKHEQKFLQQNQGVVRFRVNLSAEEQALYDSL